MATSTEIPLEISGFLILPLSLPSLPSFPNPTTHFLYLAKHQPKVPSIKTSRSLFLVNVPFDATDAHIKRLFSTQLGLPNGRIEDVHFEGAKKGARERNISLSLSPTPAKKGKKRKRALGGGFCIDAEGAELPSTWDRELRGIGRTAVISFVDQASLDAVMRAMRKTRNDKKKPVWGEGLEDIDPSLGPSRYLNHQGLQYPDKAQLLESVNAFMTAVAAQEASEAKFYAKQRHEPDEDGFITVSKGGRNGPARREAAQEQAEKRKEKHKGFEDFYRFQTRDKRKAKAVELLRKFEGDKQKVKEMRERRASLKVNGSLRIRRLTT